MKRVLVRKVLCILAVFAVICSVFVPVSAEDTAVSAAYTALKNPAGELIAVSKYGDTEHFPEQSLEGLLAASGIDCSRSHASAIASSAFAVRRSRAMQPVTRSNSPSAVSARLSESWTPWRVMPSSDAISLRERS